MCKTNKSKLLAGWIKGIIFGPPQLEHVGLPNVLDLAVHLSFFGWVS